MPNDTDDPRILHQVERPLVVFVPDTSYSDHGARNAGRFSELAVVVWKGGPIDWSVVLARPWHSVRAERIVEMRVDIDHHVSSLNGSAGLNSTIIPSG